MYNKNFFQKQFALTPTQAEDYVKAFKRICFLLQDYDPLLQHRHHQFYSYEKEALYLMTELPAVRHLAAAADLLQKVGFSSARLNKTERAAAAKALLSISDNYIWPASVYDDWKEDILQDKKTTFKPLKTAAPANNSIKAKKK